MNARPNIVLVHGAWADGSSWSAVIERLQAGGYHVTAPQFPLTALADDVARLRQVLDLQDGPTIVAGHSYGGQIMTALGTDAPGVVGLVYIAAFGLDQGESLGVLLSQGPVTPALAHLVTDKRGFGWLSEDDFVNHFAGDVDPVRARVMYAVQQPLATSAFGDVMGVPAWKTLPSWYLVATDDERRAILEGEHLAQPGDVVGQRAQRKLRRSDLETVGLQTLNDTAPAGPLCPCAMN